MSMVEKYKTPFTVVMQYQELLNNNTYGQSYYDYFRTGNDGLIWDCFQIIALSKLTPSINNTSPIWKCAINGQTLSLSDMDSAYISFLGKWLRNSIEQDTNYIFDIHERVSIEYERHQQLQTKRN